MLINLLLALLCISGLAIVFLWLKMKKATIESVGFKAAQDQRVATEESKVIIELERRVEEEREKSRNAKEALDKFNVAWNKLRDSTD